MRKVFLAAIVVLMASLQASGVPSPPKTPLPNLGIPPAPLASPEPFSASVPFSMLSPKNQSLFSGPTATIPSTPITIAPLPLNNLSVYPQSQGILGPSSQNYFGLSLGFPLGSLSSSRTRGGRKPVSNEFAQRMNSK